jgi:O-methyltransferase
MRGAGRIIRGLGALLGVDVTVAPKGAGRIEDTLETIDRNMLSIYWNRDRLVGFYEDSMRATGMEWSDNFSKRCRFFSLCEIFETALNNSNGDVVECGCWRGHSAHMMATMLKQRDFSERFAIFDSFEGLSALLPEDRNERTVLTPEQIQKQATMLACSEDVVRANLAAFEFIDYYKGWIPSRFGDVADRTFSLVHVDVDLYQPYKDTIEFFYPRLARGGAMVFDDYGLTQFPGAKRAVDEAVARFKPSFFYQIPTGGAFLLA